MSRWFCFALMFCVVGCSNGGSTSNDDANPQDSMTDIDAAVRDVYAPVGDGDTPPTLFHQSDPLPLASGGEIAQRCESWHLHNTEMLYVNAVDFQATAGMHHSNWFFVPSNYYAGPDGSWDCTSRGFDEGLAAFGGGVLFAQSTQTTHETQQFAPGTVIPIPPNSIIVGGIHMLNVTGAPINVQFSLALTPIPREQVTTRLSGLELDYLPLSIPPHAQSSFTTECDLNTIHQQMLGRPLDFHIYYALPHYHVLGRNMRIAVVGGPHDGEVIFETNALIGEPLGHALMPAFDMAGATGLSLECTFDNPRSDTVHYGIGSQEMCTFLAFTDSPLQWSATAPRTSPNVVTGETNNVVTNTSVCSNVIAIPERSFNR